jgi:hypothetical protein
MIPGGGTMPSNRWNRELPLTQPKTAENILWLRLAATGFRAGPNSRPLLDAHRLTSDRVRSDVAWRDYRAGCADSAATPYRAAATLIAWSGRPNRQPVD